MEEGSDYCLDPHLLQKPACFGREAPQLMQNFPTGGSGDGGITELAGSATLAAGCGADTETDSGRLLAPTSRTTAAPTIDPMPAKNVKPSPTGCELELTVCVTRVST